VIIEVKFRRYNWLGTVFVVFISNQVWHSRMSAEFVRKTLAG